MNKIKLRNIVIISMISIIAIISIGFGTYQYNKGQTYNNLITNANKEMDQENYDQAIALFNQSLQYKTDKNVESSIKLASTLKEMKVAYDEGIKLMNDKKYQEAIDQFNKISKENNKLYNDSQKNIDKCKQELLKESKNNNSNSKKQTVTDNKNTDTNVGKEEVTYKLYKNGRYDFSIEYPSILQSKQLSANGDGIRLSTTDGSTELTVSGINNVSNETVVSEYNKLVSEHSNASYKKQQDNWFIVTWVEGDKIVYEKRVIGSGSSNTFIIKYSISNKDYYDSIISHLNSTFNTPGIGEGH